MKGQIINVDFAVAAGLFVVGVASAMTIAFTLWQAPQGGLTEQLGEETYQVADRFSQQTEWQARFENFSSGTGSGLLVVEEVSYDGSLAVSGGQPVPFDRFGDKVVFASLDPFYSIFSSSSNFSKVEEEHSYSFDTESFSNSVINANYSGNGLEFYEIGGSKLVEDLRVDDTVIEDRESGNVSATVDYGEQEIFMKGGQGQKTQQSINSGSDWQAGSFSSTEVDGDAVRLEGGYESVEKTGFYKPDVDFNLQHTFMTDSNPNGGSWNSAPNQEGSSNPEPPYSSTWSLQNNSNDGDNQMYGTGWDSYTFDNDDWFLTWIRFTESSPPDWLMIQLNGWDYRIQTGGSSCRYSPCNITDIEEPEPGKWESFLFKASDTENSANGTSIGGVAWTPPDTTSPNQAFYADSGLAVENPQVFSNYSSTGNYTASEIDNTENTEWNKVQVNASIPEQTSLDLIFTALDSSGSTVDTYRKDVEDGLKNYTVNLQDSEEGQLKFIGSTSNESKTWKVYNSTVYSGSRAARDVYIRSTGGSTYLEVKQELDNVELVENSMSYDLNQSRTLYGESPLAFYGSKALAVTGPGIEWKLESEQNRYTNLSVNGSYYISGFNSFGAAEERAEASSEFSSRFSRNITGIRLDKAEEVFNSTGLLFENDLGIPPGLSYNISFMDQHQGENLPLSGTVISRSIPQVVLHDDGTVTTEDLEVRLWR